MQYSAVAPCCAFCKPLLDLIQGWALCTFQRLMWLIRSAVFGYVRKTFLSVLFHVGVGEESMAGLPLMSPMGWKQSPPILTAATETVVDLANRRLVDNNDAPHRLDMVAETAIPVAPLATATHTDMIPLPVPNMDAPCHRDVPSSVKSWNVYVDDFIGRVQGNWRNR
jgi:hypothetical protein